MINLETDTLAVKRFKTVAVNQLLIEEIIVIVSYLSNRKDVVGIFVEDVGFRPGLDVFPVANIFVDLVMSVSRKAETISVIFVGALNLAIAPGQ